MNATLVLLSKLPRPGAVKTRLCPPLSPQEAAALFEACFLDAIDAVEAVPLELDKRLVLALAASETTAAAAPYLRPGWTVQRQVDGDLGARIEGALQSVERWPALVIGADAPLLGAARLGAALRALQDHAVVLGPVEDGGYDLIGLDRPRPELFHGIPWSTAAVLETTVRRAAPLRPHLLPLSMDLDRPEDLRPCLARLEADPTVGARTRRALAALLASPRSPT
ncbi:MAG: TIGR04282 family arsenosugar biosynthesis glycosyltransferase [Myxococcota bacterium]